MTHELDETQYRPKYPDSPFIHIADLVNPKTGKTYREENAELVHNIPIGALVEYVGYENGDEWDNRNVGIRLFVVFHARDCDQTPLYCLCADRDKTQQETQGWFNHKWDCGYPEESLKVIKLPDAAPESEGGAG